MKRIRCSTSLAAVLALTAVACGPAEDRGEAWNDEDRMTDAPTPEMSAQFATLRAEVDSILEELRAEVEAMGEGLIDEPLERWTEVSSSVEETRGELLSDLDQLRTADRDEALRIRERASERIAELEAEVVRGELELSPDAQTLAERVNHHLSDLESDLTQVAAHIVDLSAEGDTARTRAPETRPGTGLGERTRTISADDLERMREDLVELREEAEGIPERAAEDDFESVRDDLSGSVADLTRDVKRHWYRLEWEARSATRNN
jgi:hypothetical protein